LKAASNRKVPETIKRQQVTKHAGRNI